MSRIERFARTTLLSLLVFGGSAAVADCPQEQGSVKILGDEFPALQAVAAAAASCANGSVSVTTNLTKDYRDLQVAALSSKPAGYTSAIVANNSIVPLLNHSLIQPLDRFVEKYGSDLRQEQLVTVNGQIMAIAFLANAQHLFYREDILQAAGLAVPVSYTELLAAAKVIREQELVSYPIGGTYQAGWNLALEFINLYLANDASLFVKNTAEPAINNPHGVAALQMMKSLSEFMSPDYLTHDTNAVTSEWESGNTAFALLWGSRAASVIDEQGSQPEVTDNTRFTGAPTFTPGGHQASTLWWVGFTLAANISDADANASFKAMLHGISSDVVEANNDKAVWLVEGYKPGTTAEGVFKVIEGGAPPYPATPYMGLLHHALGVELADFLKGSESAEQALADIEAAYITAAREAGFL